MNFEKITESLESLFQPRVFVVRDRALPILDRTIEELEANAQSAEKVAVMSAKTALSAEPVAVNAIEASNHDDLGVNPEQRATEVETLNRLYSTPSANEPVTGVSNLEADARQKLDDIFAGQA